MSRWNDWRAQAALGCIGFVIIIAALQFQHRSLLPRLSAPSDGPFYEIPYRGHLIKLRRKYRDYSEYKDDPENIDPSEIKLVQKLVSEAPVARFYPSQEAWIKGGMDWTFPGYGSTVFGDTAVQENGSKVEMFSYEIPQANRDRFLVFRIKGQTFTLLDNFFADNDANIAKLRIENGQILYYTGQGVLVFKHAALPEREKR